MNKPVILTGIRSNENPTIANYFGAIKPIVEIQNKYSDDYQINMFVPDLHSITTPVDYSSLYQNTINNLKYFMASGLNVLNENTFIYRQSYIPAHSELTWILNCFTHTGELRRMTQFKSKNEDQAKNTSVGLFDYPVLMAADILLYNSKWIPVGEDQFQHLELARDLAIRFNNKFGDIFVIPENTMNQSKFLNRDQGLRIRSLTDPFAKMSKSSLDDNSKICLTDSTKDIEKKIMSATTDSIGTINLDWDKQPGVSNLLQLLSLVTGKELSAIIQIWRGKTAYSDLKREVANKIIDFINEFNVNLSKIEDNEVISKLEINEKLMNVQANNTLLRVQQAVGLRPKK